MDLISQLQACHQSYEAGDLQRAEQQLGRIVQQFPNAPDAYHLGALIAQRANQNQAALHRIKLALARQINHHEYLNTQGNIYVALQDIPNAVMAYSASLKAKPDYLHAAQNLGRCLVDNDNPEAAISVFKKALSHNPDDQQLNIGLIIAFKEATRSEDALAALDALETDANYGYLRGQILQQLDRHDEAIEAAKTALSDKKRAASALQNISQSYWMQGDWEMGEQELKKVLDDKDAGLDIFITASVVYKRAGQMDMAENVLSRASKKFGENPDIQAALARLKLEGGDYTSAFELAYKALTARPGDLKLMEIFAESALVSGRPNDAMVAAHEALKVIPNNQFWIAVKFTAGRAMGQDYKFYADTDKFVKAYRLQPPEKYGSIENFNKELKAALEKLHQFDQHPLDQSLRLGTQTLTDLRFSDVPVIRDFFEALDVPIKSYMEELGDNAIHPLDRRNTGKYRLAGAWSVLLRAGGHHVNHVHPKGWISSSYYVDVPDEIENTDTHAGWIQFGQPPIEIKDQQGNVLGPERFIKPEPGLVVLFPSYLWHGTVPITGTSTRLTLPFDVVPA